MDEAPIKIGFVLPLLIYSVILSEMLSSLWLVYFGCRKKENFLFRIRIRPTAYFQRKYTRVWITDFSL